MEPHTGAGEPAAEIRTPRRRGAVRDRVVRGGSAGSVTELIRSAGLTGLVRRASEYTYAAKRSGTRAGGGTDADRVLPVVPELRPLLPAGGLRRGTTVAVATSGSAAAPASSARLGPGAATGSAVASGSSARLGSGAATGPGAAGPGSGATSVLLALLAAASQAGSWCAVVGVPALGAVAAAEAGIELSRLALVPSPGLGWTRVVAALLDGVDIVVVAPPGPVAAPVVDRLAARARQRGAVLVPYGRWDSADVVLQAVGGVWEGLGAGHGRLRCRRLTVTAWGRGAAAHHREAHLWLPASLGGVAVTGSPPVHLAGSGVRDTAGAQA